jgi:hypothetical protein
MEKAITHLESKSTFCGSPAGTVPRGDRDGNMPGVAERQSTTTGALNENKAPDSLILHFSRVRRAC